MVRKKSKIEEKHIFKESIKVFEDPSGKFKSFSIKQNHFSRVEETKELVLTKDNTGSSPNSGLVRG